MSKKQAFIEEVRGMMDSLGYTWQSDDAATYWDAFTSQKEEEKPMFTDNGKLILKYMQENLDTPMFKAKDIGEGIFCSSRTVSGAIRKLVTDGFVEKVGQDPVIYSLTDAGKAVTFEE